MVEIYRNLKDMREKFSRLLSIVSDLGKKENQIRDTESQTKLLKSRLSSNEMFERISEQLHICPFCLYDARPPRWHFEKKMTCSRKITFLMEFRDYHKKLITWNGPNSIQSAWKCLLCNTMQTMGRPSRPV